MESTTVSADSEEYHVLPDDAAEVNDEVDDSFLQYSTAKEEEEKHTEDGWQSDRISRIAKDISKLSLKIAKVRSKSNHAESSSSVRLCEEDLMRAAEIIRHEEESYHSCLPNKLNHGYMCALWFFTLLILGGALLGIGLRGDFVSLNVTPYETRLLAVPNSRWYSCLIWHKKAAVGEVGFYLFDSEPQYASQPLVVTQTRNVKIGASRLRYLQFYINAGGQANFTWSFYSQMTWLGISPIDVFWVKGSSEFQSLVAQDPESERNNRISSSSSDSYSSITQDSDDYYLVFRNKAMIGGINTLTSAVNVVVSTPTYNLSTAVKKINGTGELCFPFNTPTYMVLSIAHPRVEDALYVLYRFSKRYEVTASVTGSIAGVIFILLTLFWIVMAIREYRNRKRRLSTDNQDEENPQELNQFGGLAELFSAPQQPQPEPQPQPDDQLQPDDQQPDNQLQPDDDQLQLEPANQPLSQPGDPLQPQTNEEDWW